MNTTGTNRADAGSNACTEREQAVQKLLLECEEQINLFEYEKALDICKEIYGLEPQNKETLLLESTILIELDQIEDAKNILRRLCDIDGDDMHYEKYLILGQITNEFESLSYYQKSLSIINNLINTNDNNSMTSKDQHEFPDEDGHLKFLKSSILCSMAELFLTDLCMQPDAEQQCQHLLEIALDLDPLNVEVLQTMANFNMSQNLPLVAKENLMKSFSGWSHLLTMDSDEYDDLDGENSLKVDELPSYEFRLCCCRLMIELGMFTESLLVATNLTNEDDSIVEPWYLVALSLYELQNYKESNEILQHAESLLADESGGVGEGEGVDDFLSDAVNELREHLNEKGFSHTAPLDEEDEQMVQ